MTIFESKKGKVRFYCRNIFEKRLWFPIRIRPYRKNKTKVSNCYDFGPFTLVIDIWDKK